MIKACEVIKGGRHPTISLDNHAVAKAITEHLISLGHRRIGLIQGPQNSPLTQDRVAGYQAALDQELIKQKCTSQLFTDGPKAPLAA